MTPPNRIAKGQPEQAYALPPAPGDEPAPEDPDAV